ncbi:Uncharacterised protein [Bordetella pertussis]|nr:Uncharacterised protein [Bordetella pertussis]CFT98355.1 Uncharacterised protein [Bordetella pertussis]CPO71517.1 Uncharacterised protein [Bordetella pertussis]CPP85913.1 Uncharacterised protein [Bordetella pertussis]CRE33347.1 Uncharacterised protein [Bordetella pertussis]
MVAMVTTAKASLISYRSTSLACQPVFLNRFFSAPTGAVVNQFGSCACWAWATMRASGLTPSFSAVEARISTMAAAPSEIDDELAAVTVPSFLKAGLSVGIFSGMALVGASSVSITVSPLRPATVTGVISHLKLPSSLAARARRSDSSEKASCCSRVKLYLVAQSSANTPIALPRS